MKLYQRVLKAYKERNQSLEETHLKLGKGPACVALLLAAELVEILADIRDALQKLAKIRPMEEEVVFDDEPPK